MAAIVSTLQNFGGVVLKNCGFVNITTSEFEFYT